MDEDTKARGRDRPLRVLFVCTLNQWRSPTAEAIYRGDPRLEVRSAGTRSGARRRVGPSDLAWADAVLVMEADHKNWIHEKFGDLDLPPVRILRISNGLGFMDDDLRRQLRDAIEPELDELLRARPLRP